MTQIQRFFSRRFSSFSTASRRKSERFSFVSGSRTRSMRSSVPPGNLAGICSSLICFRPMRDILDDITYCYKWQNT